MGKIRSAKKGEPDVGQFARMVLNDWQRSKLPFYELPKCFEVPLSRQMYQEQLKMTRNKRKKTTQFQRLCKMLTKKKKDSWQTFIYVNILIAAHDFAKTGVGLQFDNDDDDVRDLLIKQIFLKTLKQSTMLRIRKIMIIQFCYRGNSWRNWLIIRY